ncbi:MAG: 3-phosphoshikimate 1-carboxyvinyltransferase [Bacteroidia bacterium]|nr:3-phosphoshikimate 1-carboxyvinyltransferase [Bacteroidia bacterium]
MLLKLRKSSLINDSQINITGSKSESNRLLILQALLHGIELENISNADDVQLMMKALASDSKEVDIHHAGTAMRFLSSYFASSPGRNVILTGSTRMKQRPIGILVDALRSMGAEIEYVENEGFPPLKINGKQLKSNHVKLKAGISSQYITSLMLIGSRIPGGLKIELEGDLTSVPYIMMTEKLLNQVGATCSFQNKTIKVAEYSKNTEKKLITVESDWSSASYYYSLVALSAVGTSVSISSYKEDSLQGDSALKELYPEFGVSSEFIGNKLILKKNYNPEIKSLHFDLINTPDIAQTIAVTCLGLGLDCHLTGLHTLKIKETDRLMALKTEIEKFGGKVIITDESLTLESPGKLKSDCTVNTYNDHRMAMAFAPLALVTDLLIADADVVSKSYPDFWKDWSALGIEISDFQNNTPNT